MVIVSDERDQGGGGEKFVEEMLEVTGTSVIIFW